MFGRKQYQIDHQRDAQIARVTILCGGSGMIWGYLASESWLVAFATGALTTIIGLIIYVIVTIGSAKLVGHALFPDTRGQAGVGYSHIEALEAKGDLVGALAAWEAVMDADPTAVAARMQAADLYARKSDDHARAAAIFKVIQTHPKANAEVQRYASQRLIDLYFGKLKDEGRALVEMRKLIDRWPETREAAYARDALARIKKHAPEKHE